VEKGRDPREAKQTAKDKAAAAAVNTVQFVRENFIKREGAKLRTLDQRARLLKRAVYPRIGHKLIGRADALRDQPDARRRRQLALACEQAQEQERPSPAIEQSGIGHRAGAPAHWRQPVCVHARRQAAGQLWPC
jgi:hypothetical protein